MAAKMKGLDRPSSRSSSSNAPRPHKDINTFVNNQLKFVSGSCSIPPEQMKCNILKANAEGKSQRRK